MSSSGAGEPGKPAFQRDQLAFFWLAVTFGTAGMIATAGAPVAGVVWTLLIMALYFTVSVTRKSGVITRASFADSLYYLGFTFTMIALVISLVIVAGASEDNLDVRMILGQFGVALTTTVVGLVARTSLVTFRVGLVEEREAAGAQLIRETEKFQRQLERARAGLEGQTGVIQETLARSTSTVQVQVDASAEALKKSTDRLTKTSAETASALSKSTALSIKQTEEVGAHFAESAEALLQDAKNSVADALAGLEEAIDATKRRLEAFEVDSQFLADGVAPAVEELSDSLKKHTAKINNSANEWIRLSARIGGTTTQLESLGHALGDYESTAAAVMQVAANVEKIKEHLELAVSNLTSVPGSVSDASGALDNFESSVTLLTEALATHATELETLSIELRKNVREASAGVKGVNSTLVDAVGFITRELGSGGDGA